MQMYRKVFPSIAGIVLALCAFALQTSAQRVSDPFYTNETRIFSLINRERGRTGLGQLGWDDRLADLARRYSEKMAREHFFEHIDSDGNDVVARARQSRIRGWDRIGENLFMCSPTNDYTSLSIRGWMHSPSHRENLLDPDWTETGVGVAVDRDGTIYITEVFVD
jgi:uncharacterized protein YkwD